MVRIYEVIGTHSGLALLPASVKARKWTWSQRRYRCLSEYAGTSTATERVVLRGTRAAQEGSGLCRWNEEEGSEAPARSVVWGPVHDRKDSRMEKRRSDGGLRPGSRRWGVCACVCEELACGEVEAGPLRREGWGSQWCDLGNRFGKLLVRSKGYPLHESIKCASASDKRSLVTLSSSEPITTSIKFYCSNFQ